MSFKKRKHIKEDHQIVQKKKKKKDLRFLL